ISAPKMPGIASKTRQVVREYSRSILAKISVLQKLAIFVQKFRSGSLVCTSPIALVIRLQKIMKSSYRGYWLSVFLPIYLPNLLDGGLFLRGKPCAYKSSHVQMQIR